MSNKPFLLTPACKDYIWGGCRLNDDFNLGISISPFAEAWVCSTHPAGISAVPGYDCSLKDLLTAHPEYLGTHVLQITGNNAELPILIKLIDAKNDLSVQVHPDDEYARKNEGQWGKTEMWYVLGAEKKAELVYGFNQDVSEKMVKEAISKGKITALLNHVHVNKDDVFFIKSGTVHAIGAGCLIAEIQQSSDLTYRLYDYNRVDKQGKRRELHIDKALDVMNMSSSVVPRQPLRVLKYKPGYATELLSRCKYFQVERLVLDTQNRRTAEFKTNKNSFHALLCVDGCGVLWGKDMLLPFFKGDCIFVPADSIEIVMHGRAQLLDVSC